MKDEQTEAIKRYNEQQAIIINDYIIQSKISQLEELKEKIYDIDEPSYQFEGFYLCQEAVLLLIDVAIEELKGDKK